MRSAGICFAFLAMVAPCACWGHAAGQNPSPIDAADRLFQAGQFAQAREQYTRIAAEHPDDYSAILQLGRIALLSNRLDDAKTWLERAIALRPGDSDPKVMLAEAYYRRDDFEKAVASLSGVDVSANQLLIAQYPTPECCEARELHFPSPIPKMRLFCSKDGCFLWIGLETDGRCSGKPTAGNLGRSRLLCWAVVCCSQAIISSRSSHVGLISPKLGVSF
jgi:tetratricopeptide (TPR) repeat protein